MKDLINLFLFVDLKLLLLQHHNSFIFFIIPFESYFLYLRAIFDFHLFHFL